MHRLKFMLGTEVGMHHQCLSIGILTYRLSKGFGVDVVVHAQARLLVQRGHSVTVYAFDHEPLHLSPEGYTVKLLPKQNFDIVRFLRLEKHDCYVAHTSPFFELLPELQQWASVFAYEHGDPTPELFPLVEMKSRREIKRVKQKHVYNRIDGVLAISEFIRRDIEFPDATILYNGADHLLLQASDKSLPLDSKIEPKIEPKSQMRSALGLDPHKKMFLTVARLGEGESHYKGLDLFAELGQKIASNNVQMVVVGRGTPEDRAKFEALGIRVLLNASTNELRMAYSACDAFVSLSKWEGFNLPLVEAQSLKIAAYSLNNACHTEVCPNTFSSLNELAKFLSAASDQDFARDAQNGWNFVQKYTWKQNADQFEKYLLQHVELRPKYSESLALQMRFAQNNLKALFNRVLKKLIARSLFLSKVERKARSHWRRLSGKDEAEGILLVQGKIHPKQLRARNTHPHKAGLLSICILTKNKLNFIEPCVRSLLETTSPDRVEILVGDTGSTDPEVLSFYKTLDSRVQIRFLGFYHFSEGNNILADAAQGEFLLFLNNDTKAFPGWLDHLLAPFVYNRVGIVGAKLLFADGSLQHAGSEVFTRAPYRYVGWHPFAKFSADFQDAEKFRTVPTVTGACLAIRHSLFNSIGGFDKNYNEECQDADLCLRAHQLFYRVIYAPTVVFYHYENGTRTLKESGTDRQYYISQWKDFLESFFLAKWKQSEDWVPHIVIDADINAPELAAFFNKLSQCSMPKPEITVKSNDPKLHLSPEIFQLIAQFTQKPPRILPGDYEDNVRYELVLQ